MASLSNKSTTLLLVILLASVTLFINPTQARAKAFDDDDGDDWADWDGSEENEDNSGIGGNENVGAKSIDANSHDDNDHDHSNHQVHAAGTFGAGGGSVPDSAKQYDGTQGANQAAFNESCSPTGKKCNTDFHVCSANDGTGRCVCKAGYVYVRQTETCWVIPKSDLEACAHDVQCHEGRWGSISRCNKGTARCECYDYKATRPTTLVDGVCFIKKNVGDLCSTHEECNGPIPGEAYCQPGDHQSAGGQQYNGSCTCRDTHLWSNTLSECLLLSTKLGDSCKINAQCMQGSLGKNSRCEDASATCKCGPPRASEEAVPESVYYEQLKKCFLKMEYNSTCEEKTECQASLGPDVDCGSTDDFPDQNICHCPSGKVCRSSAFSIVPNWVLSVAVVGMALVRNGLTSRG